MAEARNARIERVIVGVIRQAFVDAGTNRFESDDEYVSGLCERAGGIRGPGLVVSAVTKTALLLGAAPRADLYPLGDLYSVQCAELTGDSRVPQELSELASAMGGAETLDRVLQRLFDRREDWASATAGLSAEARTLLREKLDAARFRRTRVGLVPKLGARTPGIDLHA